MSEVATRKVPQRRPWRQYGLPKAERLPFYSDNRKAVGMRLTAFRRGVIEQIGGEDHLTASQLERLDALCVIKARLLASDIAAPADALSVQDYAALLRELERLLSSLERSANPVRRHEKVTKPEQPELPDVAALAWHDD
jgi:hypothetical protein